MKGPFTLAPIRMQHQARTVDAFGKTGAIHQATGMGGVFLGMAPSPTAKRAAGGDEPIHGLQSSGEPE